MVPVMGAGRGGDRELPRDTADDATYLSGARAREQVRNVVLACAAEAGKAPDSVQQRVADAELICSELVSNARRHGSGLTSFRVWHERGCVLIQVSDRSAALPVTSEGPRAEPGGFGWALVRKLAASVSVDAHSDGSGKTITAYLPMG
ncbi:ATP-binding protein [Streptomyces sp. NPDC016845]|uniref:ATP-binding protein n=1 Tax=Streptomyces sp. NPDC016845 TaxID=3364972 RepID=UPI0037A7E510